MVPRARLTAMATVAGALLGAAPLSAASAQAAPRAGAGLVRGHTTLPGAGLVRGHTTLPGAAPVRTGGTAPAATTQTAEPSGVTAKGAYLYDATGNRKLWGRATTTRRPVGSITKVMTALVVIRAGGLDRKVTIKKSYADHVRHSDATTAGLRVGDKVTVRQLLYGMMLPSGCDAAYALADVYGPGQTRFVAKMNRTAASLGMTGTHFINADGLPSSSHAEGRSTPRDVILLARAAMKSATFRDVVAHETYRLAAGSGHHAYTWTNTNRLLGSYQGATGVKTGHTDAAGYCLLFSATRGGRTLIGVVLDSTTTDPDRRFTSAARMLDWGFGTRSARITLRSLPAGTPAD